MKDSGTEYYRSRIDARLDTFDALDGIAQLRYAVDMVANHGSMRGMKAANALSLARAIYACGWDPKSTHRVDRKVYRALKGFSLEIIRDRALYFRGEGGRDV